MNQSTFADSKKWLSSIFKNSLKPRIYFAKLSIDGFRWPKYFEYFVILLEYAQLMSQILLFAPALYQDPTFSEDIFAKTIVFLAKVLNPGSFLIESQSNSTTTTVVMVLLILFVLIKISVCGYIAILSKRGFSGRNLMISVWKVIFRLQVRVLYLWITSFWVNIIISSLNKNGITLFGLDKLWSIFLSVLFILAEFLFSGCLVSYFSYILPSKDEFSAKSNILEATTFLQKVVAQILQMTSTAGLFSNWLFSVITTLIGIARIAYFSLWIPIYKIRALQFQASLILSVTLLSLAFLSQTLLQSINETHNIQFVLIIWIILSILGVQLSRGFIQKQILLILLSKTEAKSPELLIHRMSLIKEMRKLKKVHCPMSDHYDLYYLVNMTVEVDFRKTLKKEGDIIDSKKTLNKIFLNYLEDLNKKSPKNDDIKLHLAYYYGKKMRLYQNALKCIEELTQSTRRFHVKLTASLLLLEIQENIKNEVQEEGSGKLDLSSYMKSISLTNELESQILAQTELQIKSYTEILGEKPDLAKIFNLSQEIKSYRQEIEKKMKFIWKDTPEYNISPLMLYAEYQLKINHSMRNYLYFQEISQKKWKKFERNFKNNQLNQHNIYLPNTVFIVVSTPQPNKASIVYCSKSIEQVYGGEASSYLGTDVNSLIPPSLRRNATLTESVFSNIEEGNNTSILKKVITTYSNNKEGHLIPVEVLMDVFPIMTQGLFIMMAVRQIPLVGKDYLFVQKNGDIECATKRVTEKLGLQIGKTNIRSLSEELFEAHLAFNKLGLLDEREIASVINEKQRNEKHLRINPGTEEDEAKYLFDLYSNEGRSLELKNRQRKIRYHCNIQNYLFPSAFIKIVVLTENSHEQANKGSHRTSFEMKAEADTLVDDEKQEGWIEFDRIASTVAARETRINTREARGSALIKKLGNIISTTVGEELISSSRTSRRFMNLPPLKAIESKSINADDDDDEIDISSSHESEFEDFEGEVRELTAPFGRVMSIASSQASRTSHKKNVLDAFSAAVSAKSYSRSSVLMILLFYLGLVSVFAIQFGLVVALEKNFSTFQLKKDLLNVEQRRRYFLLLTNFQVRTSIDVISGTIQATEFGVISPLVALMVLGNTWTGPLASFVESNRELFNNCTGLEDYVRESVFEKNIRHYQYEDSNSIIKVDSFQSADLFSEEILGIGKLLMAYQGAEALARFTVTAQNSLNDLFINIEHNLEVFLDSVHRQRENIDAVVQGFLIAILIWLGCVAVFFAAFLRRLYLKEQRNLFAVTKLDVKALNVTLENMKAFRDKIVTKRSNERSKGAIVKDKEQNVGSKTPVFTGVRNKYLIYLPKFLPFLITTIGFIVGNSIAVNRSLDKLQSIQEIINQSMDTICIITTAFISAEEMLLLNDAASIKNHAPSVELAQQIGAIDSVKNGLLNFLTQDNQGLVNSEIINIFLSDGCQYSADLAVLCQVLDLFGQKSGVINLLNYLQGILIEKLQKFNQSDGSKEDLRKTFLLNIDILTTATSIVTSEITLVTDILSEDFGETMKNAKKNRDVIFVFFSLTLLTQGFYIWFKVLGKLREAENQFKNVLETLPAHVALANFLLKSFLIRTSQGVLDASIKNYL